MKKLTILAISLLFSSGVLAEAGLTIGLGYESGEIANSDDRNGDPAGLSFMVNYSVPGTNGMFIGVDMTDNEDEADNGLPDKITTEQKRTAFEIGYRFSIDDSTSISAAVSNADIEWSWEDGVPANFNRFESDDSGVSLVVGVDKQVGNGVSIGTSLSMGFETGVEAYAAIEVVENMNVTLSYFKNSYEMEWEQFDELGSTGNGSAFNDGDFQFDTSGIRVSASYAF